MKKIFIWAILTLLIMIIFPSMVVAFAGSAGMAVCLILFFAVDPIFSVFSGIFAGTNIKKLWLLPYISSLFFLAGAWMFFDIGESAFLVYAAIYSVISTVSMLITAIAKRIIKR